MPITTLEMPYEQMMKHQKQGYHCKQCNALLSVAWGGDKGYILRCSKDINHTGVAREAELSAWDTPDGLSIGNLSRARRKSLVTQLGEEKATALVKYSGAGQLTIPEATDIITTIWPGAPLVEVKKAALVCQIYGLNPLMKHLFLVPFNTKKGDKWEVNYSMVLGIKASRIIARRKGRYAYLDDTPRVMTEAEQIKIFGEIDLTNICAITRLKDISGNTAIGTGRWPKGTEVKGGDKGNSKLNMAMIRSERQALERLFPDSFPTDAQDVVDERFEDYENGQKVDVSTGEIKAIGDIEPESVIEGELVDHTQDAQKLVEQAVKEPEIVQPVKDETPVTRDQLTQLETLLKEAGLTSTELTAYVQKDKKWKLAKWPDLKAWQFAELKEYLDRASGKV